MNVPTLRQIVDLGQANLPKTGLVYNLDFDLGLDGIVGIETGSDAAANGCYLSPRNGVSAAPTPP